MGFVAVVVVLIGAGFAWSDARSRAMLAAWASEQGYTLLNVQCCPFRRGPFCWTTSQGQTVYRVTLRTAAGAERSGWARCGSFCWGLWSEAVEVRWDDEC